MKSKLKTKEGKDVILIDFLERTTEIIHVLSPVHKSTYFDSCTFIFYKLKFNSISHKMEP